MALFSETAWPLRMRVRIEVRVLQVEREPIGMLETEVMGGGLKMLGLP